MGNKDLLEKEFDRLFEEIKSAEAWIVRHHGPGPYTVWDDDTNEIGMKEQLVERFIKQLKRVEEELNEFDRRERGEIHPLTKMSIDYGFEKNVVKWGVTAHIKGLRLPSKFLREKAQQVGYQLIQIPEIVFPNLENSIKFRYSCGSFLLLIDCFEDRIEVAEIPCTYEDYRKFGIVLEKKCFHVVTYNDIDVINSIIREFYETDDQTKNLKQ